MATVHKIAFQLFVLFFAGSVVTVAANDLRAKLRTQGESERVQVRKLIAQLQGDALTSTADKTDESDEEKQQRFLHPSTIPARAPGRVLTERDHKIFRSILRKFIAVSEDAAS